MPAPPKPPTVEWDDRPDYLIDELIAIAPDHGVVDSDWDCESDSPYCIGGHLLVLFKDMPADAQLPTFTVEHSGGEDRYEREWFHDVTWTPTGVVSTEGNATLYQFEASE